MNLIVASTTAKYKQKTKKNKQRIRILNKSILSQIRNSLTKVRLVKWYILVIPILQII